jgi:hypothetical protein
MRAVVKAFLLLLALAVVIGGIGLWYFLSSGVSAREQPGRIEEFVAAISDLCTGAERPPLARQVPLRATDSPRATGS